MNKILTIFALTIFLPSISFGVSITDICSQQKISGTVLESGYADILLQKNARNLIIDIASRNIINYILDNTDPNTAKILSINMPENIQTCDDEYLLNVSNEMSIDTADNILQTCRENVYSKNLAYIIKETKTISKGSYYILLENIFRNHTKEFTEFKNFNIDEFINKMALYNLLSFNGKPFYNAVTDIKLDNINCENNHTQLKVFDEKTNQEITDFNINGRDFHITACLNKNSNSYFKYILLFLKTNNDTYSLYERIPVFYNFYNSFNDKYDESSIIINAQNTRLTVKDKLNDNTSLIFDYMLFRKGTYLLNFALKYNDNVEYIFKDTSENKYMITPLNMSLKLYKDMVEKYCQDNANACKSMQIEKTLPVSSGFIR